MKRTTSLVFFILITLAATACGASTPPPKSAEQQFIELLTGKTTSAGEGLNLDPTQMVSAVMGVTVEAIGKNAAIFAVAFVWQWHSSWAWLEILVGLALVGGMFVGLWKPPEYLTLSEALIIVLMFVFVPLGLITYMGVLLALEFLNRQNIVNFG